MAKQPKKAGQSNEAQAKADREAAKVAKFKELASKRTGKILKAIKNLGNLSGSNYSYTAEQVEKIFSAIGEQAKRSYDRFQPRQPGEAKAEDTFQV